MNPITDSNGNVTGYYDDQMQYYDASGNPMTDNAGLPMLYDPSTNSLIDPATAYGGPPVGSTQTVNSNTPPSSFDPNAIIKLLNGQTYRYNAQGTNPVPYNPSATNMSKVLLYGGLGLVALIALTGGKK